MSTEDAPPTRSSERDEVIAAGSLIDGKYRVEREIGTGGMGQVFAAVHVELGHTVAIKVMHAARAPETDAVRRFVREGRAAALLKSDHAVRINDVGRFPSGRPYLVMEYLEGEDLERLRARHVLPIDDVVDYTLQALSALAEAHDAGLVHRDIKPQNLFLARLSDGKVRVKVLDFGLAKELPTPEHPTSALTTEHMLLGTPNFMSPEQIRNSIAVDARTDIWAMGATMFLLLTGQPPYTSSTTHGLLARILADPPPRARELRADVPEALDEVLQRCMAKDVFARFQSVADLAAALRAARPSPAEVEEPPRTVQDSGPLLEDEIPATMLAPGTLPETRRQPLAPPPSQPTKTHKLPAAPLTSPTRTLPMPRVASGVASASAAAVPVASVTPSVAASAPSSVDRIPAATAPPPARARRPWLSVALLLALAGLVVAALALRAARAHDRSQTAPPAPSGASPIDSAAAPNVVGTASAW